METKYEAAWDSWKWLHGGSEKASGEVWDEDIYTKETTLYV